MAITSYPPRPNNISIPAVVAGNILQSDDTSVSVIEDGHYGSIVMKTDNKLAVVINKDQKVSINTQSTDSMLTINNDLSSTPTIRLSYQDSFYFDGTITANGNVLFNPSCDDRILNPNLITAFTKNVDIIDHNGMTTGLRLGGRLITASATEINYIDVPAGRAVSNKALVLDNDKNIKGINELEASLLSGTLLTGSQPNITSLNNIEITGEFKLRGSVFDITPETLRYLKVIREGVAYPSKTMILDNNKNFTGINELSAATITGTLSSGPQPNITALSSLTLLTNNGLSNLNGVVTIKTSQIEQLRICYDTNNISSITTDSEGSMILRASGTNIRVANSCGFYISSHNGNNSGLYLGSDLVTSTALQLNYTNVAPGIATPLKAVVLDSNKTITGINLIQTNEIFGLVKTTSQPLIRSVSVLDIESHNGSIGLSLNGKIVNASAEQLNYLVVNPGTATASKAIVVDSSKSISGIDSLSANSLSGVLTTSQQPNISTVNVLTITHHNGTTGLKLGTTLITASGDEINRISVSPGTASPNKALVVNTTRDISSINNLTANNLYGIVQTAIQPMLNQVNVLNIDNHDGRTTGLSLDGYLVTSNAEQLNRVNVEAGVAGNNKALVLNNNCSIQGINVLSAVTLGGILTSPNQLNIRRLASIDITDHNGSDKGLSLNGVLITSSAYELNYLDVEKGIASSNKALVLDTNRNIENINSIKASTLSGVIATSMQPFISSVGTLNVMNHDGNNFGLSLNGVLIKSSAAQINYLNQRPGIASEEKAMILDIDKNISGINKLTANSFEGTLLTSHQQNLSSVSTLNIVNHNGSTTGLSLAGVLIRSTAEQLNRLNTQKGLAESGKALVIDDRRDISGINSLTSNFISGRISTAYQPEISSVDSLDIKNHNGGSTGLSLNGQIVNATAEQLNYSNVTPGVAQIVGALVLDEYKNIKGINNISATKIISEQLSLSGVISNFNTGNVIVKTYSFAQTIGRLLDIQLLPTLSFTNFQPADLINGYFCEMIGYIRPQYSEVYRFLITCNDRVRLWVNGELILHSWIGSQDVRTSSSLFLNAEQWVPIYIQYQVDIGSSPLFLLQWASQSQMGDRIPSTRLAWDNNPPASSSNHFSQNSLTIYNTSTPNANTARLSVDTGGDLLIDASGNDVNLGSADNLNIQSHNGTSRGLYLGGVLVEPTAYEMNYLKVTPGLAVANKALIIDGTKTIRGLTSITATSISCDNLSSSSFTISDLTLNGALKNFNFGNLLIRQITGPDVSGRVVSVETITDINLNGYDPKNLNSYFSLDIIGYVAPPNTETYTFHAIANDRVRIWVGNTLILNIWDENTAGIEFASTPISLIAGQWAPIYIQFQNITDSSSLQIKWSSPTMTKGYINKLNMAWDNSVTRPNTTLNSADRLTIFSSSSGLRTIQSGAISIDGNGTMSLSTASKSIRIAPTNNLNIVDHNGTTGLQLAGILVTASANELNYLTGSSPGTTTPNKVVVLGPDKQLAGLNIIAATNITGTLQTAAQPNITSIGTLSSTLNTSSDIVISSTNIFRLASDSNSCMIQAGSSTTPNSAADIFIGNYAASQTASTRKLMIKSSGFVGIQTSSPIRTLSINGSGATYCMRLINNSSDGSETAFCDFGVDSSSNLNITSNLILGSTNTASITVNSSGNMNITPSGGSVQIGNATTSTLPLEVGSSLFTLTTTSGYINSSGNVGSGVSSSTSYSMRTSSSIIVNGTVCITSDRRLKENITTLNKESCRNFIMRSKPIQYKYINDESKTIHCGLIAQDVSKTEFSNLVKIAPCSGLEEEVDIEGFVSPADAAFNVSYEEIIPILMTSMQETIEENIQLKEQVLEMKSQMSKMQLQIDKLISKLF